ncbi:MAG: hypothetical protein KDH09_11015 [Chrysiogenetes bacterium]|nr:hypothetical protein [Chrysiogenetes bacterium]
METYEEDIHPDAEEFADLEGVLGDLGARRFRKRIAKLPQPQQQAQEQQVLQQANLMANIAKKVTGGRGKAGSPMEGEMQRIRQWAKAKGYDVSKLKIESVRWFHKRTLELANLQNRYSYFSELEKPGPLETNMQMWGEWPQTTLVVLKGILATVHLKTYGAVDPNAAGYISMVDRFLNNATFKYKIDQSESVPILLKNLPAGGGAFSIGNESNGWPTATNIRMLRHPVFIEGGIQFFSELNVDQSAFTVLAGGPPPVPTPLYDGAELFVTMELDATWVRHTG